MTDNEKGRALLKEAFLEFSEDYLKENKVEEDEVFVLSPQAERRMRKLLREKKYSARERFLEMGKRVAALALTALVSIFVIASYLNKDVSEAVGYDTIGDFSVAHNVSGDGGEIVVTVTPNFSDLDAMEVRERDQGAVEVHVHVEQFPLAAVVPSLLERVDHDLADP